MPTSENEPIFVLTLQLHQQYVELDRVIESMGTGAVDSVDGIANQMTAIKDTEASLAPLRDEFIAAGRRLSNEIQAANDHTIEIVKGLMPKLAQLEKATVESAKRLFPQVQESVRAVQMQTAYGGGRRG